MELLGLAVLVVVLTALFAPEYVGTLAGKVCKAFNETMGK